MITDESTELRKYLFNRIDVKDSKEVRDLYSFLDNIQLKPLHIEHYHVKHKHSLEIEPSDFIPDNIIKKTYIMNRTTIHFTVGKLKVKLFIHSKEDSKKLILYFMMFWIIGLIEKKDLLQVFLHHFLI